MTKIQLFRSINHNCSCFFMNFNLIIYRTYLLLFQYLIIFDKLYIDAYDILIKDQ